MVPPDLTQHTHGHTHMHTHTCYPHSFYDPQLSLYRLSLAPQHSPQSPTPADSSAPPERTLSHDTAPQALPTLLPQKLLAVLLRVPLPRVGSPSGHQRGSQGAGGQGCSCCAHSSSKAGRMGRLGEGGVRGSSGRSGCPSPSYPPLPPSLLCTPWLHWLVGTSTCIQGWKYLG